MTGGVEKRERVSMLVTTVIAHAQRTELLRCGITRGGEKVGRCDTQLFPRLGITLNSQSPQSARDLGCNRPGEMNDAVFMSLSVKRGSLCRRRRRMQGSMFRELAPKRAKARQSRHWASR